MHAELPSVSVVVPARNAERTLGDCLSSLLGTSYPADRREIVVVDNASKDRTAAIVREYRVAYVHEERRGPAAARNRGIEESRGDVVAFIDADCIATSRWLDELVAGFTTERVWGAAGEIVAYPPRSGAERYEAARKSLWQKMALNLIRPFAATGNVAFRRETFARIGLFDPELLTAEDKDFSWRFFAAGLELEYKPRALVFHRHRSTGWALVRQHAGWNHGNALLHAKYGFPWSIGDELRKYGELVEVGAALARASLKQDGRDNEDVSYLYYEVLRRIGLRAGAARGLLDVSRRRRLRTQ